MRLETCHFFLPRNHKPAGSNKKSVKFCYVFESNKDKEIVHIILYLCRREMFVRFVTACNTTVLVAEKFTLNLLHATSG